MNEEPTFKDFMSEYFKLAYGMIDYEQFKFQEMIDDENLVKEIDKYRKQTSDLTPEKKQNVYEFSMLVIEQFELKDYEMPSIKEFGEMAINILKASGQKSPADPLKTILKDKN